MVESTVPEVDYTQYTNRQLAAVPLAVLAVTLLVIGGWYVATGAPMNPGVDFTGGTEFRIATDALQSEVAAVFDNQPESIRFVAADGTYVATLQSGSATSTELQTQAEDASFEVRSTDAVSANFGGEAQLLTLGGLAVAFADMSVLAFAVLRSFVPSIAVVLSAFSGIVIPVVLMNLFGIELSLGTVAALPMLIRYSVDSDILLNNHILRRSGDFYEPTVRAVHTGVTTTLTSIAVMIVMTIMATLFGIQLLAVIRTALVFGLTTDLMNTYMLNVTLLRWYKSEGVTR